MIRKCKQCKCLYTVGVNGMSDGRCDTCARIRRDKNGYAWIDYETRHTYQDVETGEIETVTREQALNQEKES